MKTLLLYLILFVPLFLFCQSTSDIVYTGGFDLNWLGVGYTSYDKEIADHEGFKESTIPVEFGFDIFFKKYFVVGVNSVLEFPKDLNPFYNTITGGSKVKSDVTIPQLSLFGGLKTRPFKKKKNQNTLFAGKLLFGNNWVVNARRSIDGCSNCTKQDINITSGLYIEPEIDYEYFGGDDNQMAFGISLGYKHFFSGDIKYSIILSSYIRRYLK